MLGGRAPNPPSPPLASWMADRPISGFQSGFVIFQCFVARKISAPVFPALAQLGIALLALDDLQPAAERWHAAAIPFSCSGVGRTRKYASTHFVFQKAKSFRLRRGRGGSRSRCGCRLELSWVKAMALSSIAAFRILAKREQCDEETLYGVTGRIL
jgi:hypothetical protein